ncbi:Interferon-induced 6-16 family [Plasmodiophora brassicae]
MGTMGLLASLTVVGFGFLIKTTGLPLLVSSAVVEWLGFSVVGPVAGSIAAAAQSFAGNIASGSIFSSLQSFAMAV